MNYLLACIMIYNFLIIILAADYEKSFLFHNIEYFNYNRLSFWSAQDPKKSLLQKVLPTLGEELKSIMSMT